MERNSLNFIAYEYKELILDSDKVSMWMDAFESFGWEMDDRQNNSIDAGGTGSTSKVVIHLKRNRKIVNKAELTRLQRNFEAYMKEIDVLEKSKTSKATIYGLSVGFVGCAFMAGSVFAVTASTPLILGCIVLAIPGFLCWSSAYFIYKKILLEQTVKVNQLVEQKYDEIYDLCEKGNQILN